MAEEKKPNLFNRLRRLFSTDVIIRNVGGKQLKVIDTDNLQSVGNLQNNSRIDRFNRMYGTSINTVYNNGQILQATRIQLFRDYEAMDSDSIISSALDIYADECTAKDEFEDTLTIMTNNDKIHKVLHNLFYDIINVEFNLWPWVRSTLKYGDFYLHLSITEKFGITNVEPISAYEMVREEGIDPKNPNKVTFKRDLMSGVATPSTIYRNDTEEYDNYEIAHFRLLNDTNFLPYGRSLLEPARKVWKQLTLMEDAMLIHRIMRAPDKRIFKIDIGNIPPNEVDTFMEGMINKMKKVPFIDESTGDYNLKYNMQNILEDFYLPVRGAESGTMIETTPGLQMDAIPDIEYLQNRMLGALKIPKAYLGFLEDTTGKASLASQDFRFARTIERVQKIIVSELTKIAIVHLYAQGFTDEEIVDFSLKLTPPSTYYEREKLELWTQKATLAGDLVEKKLFSRFWAYEHIFNMQPEQWMEEQDQIAKDAQEQFRIEQIKTEGNDPKKSGQSFGTPHDIASLYKGDAGVPKGYDEKEVPEGGWPGAGRPKEPGTYGKHAHPLGWDPMGHKQNKSAGRVVYEAQNLDNFKGLKTNLKAAALQSTYTKDEKKPGLLNEENLLDE
jgi:hypothetical protein|tara:strand:+ start:1408 stop:3249 length:1842 start_codon:yes stop_codon:yes gene_type:complete